MCCFAGAAPPKVSNTRIFARTSEGVATLVYSMKLSVAEDTAMILPVPIASASGEDALTFVNLEGYATFFDALASGFPRPQAAPLARGGSFSAPGSIVVQQVGAFEASYVPSLADFRRLDARFRLADDVWEKLPLYQDYGFAVFRLAPSTEKHIHPMAFRFATRFPDRVFFPTVHVHDGAVHQHAAFDHTLYFQVPREDGRPLADEMISMGPARTFLDTNRSEGTVLPDAPVFMRGLHGRLVNADYFVF